MVTIRPTLPGDCWLILSNLRQCEVDELTALGHTSEECLRLGLLYGDAHTVFIDGEPAGIFGITQYTDCAVPWAVFTPVIDQRPLAFLRACREWARHRCGTMVQVVDARNAAAVKWFTWLGFDVLEAEPLGLNGEPFHQVRAS